MAMVAATARITISTNKANISFTHNSVLFDVVFFNIYKKNGKCLCK